MTGSSGNRCGHDREHPRLDLIEPPSERLPAVLHDIEVAIENLFYLRHSEQFRDIGEARRSEICQAMVLVAKAEVARMDLVTKRVGKPRDDGSVVGIPADRLAEITGLNISRVNRALRELADAGWMTSCQPCELKADGTYRGYPAIRTLTPRFFRVLRVNLKLDIAAKKAADERKEAARRRRAEEPRRSPRMARSMRRLARKFDPARQQALATGTPDAERARRLMELQLRIRANHPEWPPDRWRAEAQAQLDRLG